MRSLRPRDCRSTLEQLGIDVLEITNLGPWGETSMLSSFPIKVPRPQAAEAREALTEMGFECEESSD